jgi:hypothetical protein
MGQMANAAGGYVASQLTCADAMPTMPELMKTMESAG